MILCTLNSKDTHPNLRPELKMHLRSYSNCRATHRMSVTRVSEAPIDDAMGS